MNIICVDADHKHLMELWRDAMKAAPSANVQKFGEIGAAVRYAFGIGCDVLLADLKPGCAAWDGIKVAKEIQMANPRVNIIFFSLEPHTANQQLLQDIGISGYIQRPYDIERLTEEISHLRYPPNMADSCKGD